MDPLLQEQLMNYQVRMIAMHAAITFYCCHRDDHGKGKPTSGQLPEQLSYLLPQLKQLRDILLETALDPGPI